MLIMGNWFSRRRSVQSDFNQRSVPLLILPPNSSVYFRCELKTNIYINEHWVDAEMLPVIIIAASEEKLSSHLCADFYLKQTCLPAVLYQIAFKSIKFENTSHSRCVFHHIPKKTSNRIPFLRFLRWDREAGVVAQTRGFQYALCYHSAASHPPRRRRSTLPSDTCFSGSFSSARNLHLKWGKFPQLPSRAPLHQPCLCFCLFIAVVFLDKVQLRSNDPTSRDYSRCSDCKIPCRNGNRNHSLDDTDCFFPPSSYVNLVFIVMYFSFWVEETTTQPFMSH